MTTVPKVVGDPGDTIDDRHDNTPALRFEEGAGGVYLVNPSGTRYCFSAGRQPLPGWLAYYRRMADALDIFLDPPPVPEPEAVDEPAEDSDTDESPGPVE